VEEGYLMGIHHLCVAVAAAAVALVPLAASASPPIECRQTTIGRNGYESGYEHQKDFLRYLWNRYYDCDRLEGFVDAVTEHLPSLAAHHAGLYVHCRNDGMIDATLAFVDDKHGQCSAGCFESGATAGSFYGRVYCGLRYSFGVESDLGICDLATEIGCKSSLRAQVDSLCPFKSAEDAGFEPFVHEACRFER
jgi:hypothetical protein